MPLLRRHRHRHRHRHTPRERWRWRRKQSENEDERVVVGDDDADYGHYDDDRDTFRNRCTGGRARREGAVGMIISMLEIAIVIGLTGVFEHSADTHPHPHVVIVIVIPPSNTAAADAAARG